MEMSTLVVKGLILLNAVNLHPDSVSCSQKDEDAKCHVAAAAGCRGSACRAGRKDGVSGCRLGGREGNLCVGCSFPTLPHQCAADGCVGPAAVHVTLCEGLGGLACLGSASCPCSVYIMYIVMMAWSHS